MGYRWLLRERMAERDWWKTTELAPALAERGIVLSPAQIYRLVTHTPERLSLPVLAALCDIFDCTPNDLIDIHPIEASGHGTGTESVGDVSAIRAGTRPRRARILDP
jgi:DNA-binding Xre family transcriptional regulator